MRAWRRMWRSLFRGADLDRDLDRELRSHLDDEAQDLIARGVPEDDARRRAVTRFGPVVSVTEECREARGVMLLHNFVRDARYGWRALLRQPLLLLAAASSIGLGVGVNLTVYAMANDVLLSVPSARAADDLVHIRTGNGSHVSFAAWQAFEASGALNGIAGYQIEGSVNLRDGADSVTLVPLAVTANFFDVVGVPVALGRGFNTNEARAELDPRLVVVSDGFWRRRLSADPGALGATLTLNGSPYAVVGVLPPGTRSLPGYGLAPDVYLPISASLMPAISRPREAAVMLIGRLRDGQTIAQGRAAVEAVAARFGEESGDREGAVITQFARVGGVDQVRDFEVVGAFFVVLLVVAGLVLCIACANVAGLLVARGASRRREIALRLSLGASRGRLVRQLLTEGLLLASVGTLLGVGLTWAIGLAVSRVSLPLPLPVRLQPVFDLRLALAGLGLVLITTILAALLPALQATRPRLVSAIKGASAPGVPRRLTLGRALVVGQVAISVLLLVVTTMFLRNLGRAASVDPGFDVGRVLVAQVTFVEGRQGGADDPAAARLLDAVRALPGVQTAAFSESVPLTLYSGSWNGTSLVIGSSGVDPVHAEFARSRVGPGYFDTMGIPIMGREFTPADRRGAERVTIVNDEFVVRYFGGVDPIGQTFAEPRRDGAVVRRVIGVAATSKYQTLGEADSPAMYDPLLQQDEAGRLVHVLMRTAGPPADLASDARAAMLAIDGSMAVSVQPMSTALAFAFLPSRVGALLLGAFGMLGTGLAMVGLYGVVSFAVTRRTTEIGVRMALGATRAAVRLLMLREAAGLVALGLILGLGLAALVTRPLAAFLVAGLSPSDPASFAATAVLLLAASLAAAWGPVRRATRVEPIAALRHE